LLAVAEDTLIERGYEGATLDLIASRAKVSKKTIYAKYGGKPGLLWAVLRRRVDASWNPTSACSIVRIRSKAFVSGRM
jgi:AcrR family transcriptional regulator